MRNSLSLAIAMLASSTALAQTAPPTLPFRDPTLPIDQRVDDIVGRLTQEEKASQLVNQARAVPRLGIPEYNWWSEALHGVANNGFVTVFPEPVGLAATFDPDAIKAMGEAIGTEGRVRWNQVERSGQPHRIMQGLTYWSPNINIFRDPRWGRGQETYGEDPFLTAKLGIAFVQGMQGDDPLHYRVSATAKHYAVHSGPEPTRHSDNITVSLHDMEDTYLPAFRALVVEGKVESIMCAYNSVNGQPACASDFLLTQRLRNAWGFKGHVVSDCDSIADIQRGHHYVASYAEAAALSMKLGVDNDCAEYGRTAGATSDYDRYLEAMRSGLLPEGVVDTSLRRLFRARIRLGMFDPAGTGPYAAIPDSALNSAPHKALALKLARNSMVLLKNNGVLPVAPSKVKKIAVVGPLADQVDVLLGNYRGTPLKPVTALEGLRAEYPGAEIVFEPGTDFLRLAEPVPTSALTTPDGQPGLRGQYWANADFSGDPALTRIDARVMFDRNAPAALPGVATVSTRWTGSVAAPADGKYRIGIEGRNAKLWIDDKLVADNTDQQQRGPNLTEMTFRKGERHAVRIEQAAGRFPPRFLWNEIRADALGKAVSAAKDADLVVAVVGITSALEGEEMTVNIPGFIGGDRSSIDLPAPEEDVLKAVKATGKPLVVVLLNGSALAVNWAAENADAIVDAWYPGQEGGTAIAQTLSGANNPSGRLPVTFYKSADQLPPFREYGMAGRTYRYFTGKPLYPFGHGLSYARFGYSPVKLTGATIAAGATLGVDVTVRNEGAVAGDEVAQLYLHFPDAPAMPVRALRGFRRITLAPGESKAVHFDLDPRDLSSVTAEGKRIVAPGKYTLTIGGGQPDTGAPVTRASFTVKGSQALPE
ncbi:glycoside hydrolase family 3 C-terminal domain-containing protein [Sphingomonas hengshuiensis]|uniref:Beta-glucosidase n=1 Tax=Sphingomonas hengshuiensis TaxID=1609977 RepID=A0A7U4J9E6_9SPHN|nr:glycoside hydrolase family 3 C-terminal domain-containing protein [Sphingomonas hengshuiensis]AJP72661.1 beta-glucosidase [Sphingomonas hengshuiensis]